MQYDSTILKKPELVPHGQTFRLRFTHNNSHLLGLKVNAHTATTGILGRVQPVVSGRVITTLRESVTVRTGEGRLVEVHVHSDWLEAVLCPNCAAPLKDHSWKEPDLLWCPTCDIRGVVVDTDIRRPHLMTDEEKRAVWGNRGEPPAAGDIVGWQIDPAHPIGYAFVRGWRSSQIKATHIHLDEGFFFLDPADIISVYRPTET